MTRNNAVIKRLYVYPFNTRQISERQPSQTEIVTRTPHLASRRQPSTVHLDSLTARDRGTSARVRNANSRRYTLLCASRGTSSPFVRTVPVIKRNGESSSLFWLGCSE
ncbi:unnamed protein product [Lasius platythorax]|uniref:Uncharacterized protein n=1 Tax=Lasius platythorax TaxID=488582 RepID=A0AAV2N2K2_9HYME